MPAVEITDATVARLQGIAVPLVDNFDSVVARLLDHWDLTKSNKLAVLKPGEPISTEHDGQTMAFDPAKPPQLNFTVCVQAAVNGKAVPKAENNWNALMNRMIREVYAKGHNAQAIYDMLFVNAAVGIKEGGGYKHLADIGLSVQGQDSNAAFRQAYQLALTHNIPFEIWFYWPNNDKAAYPNKKGVLRLSHN